MYAYTGSLTFGTSTSAQHMQGFFYSTVDGGGLGFDANRSVRNVIMEDIYRDIHNPLLPEVLEDR